MKSPLVSALVVLVGGVGCVSKPPEEPTDPAGTMTPGGTGGGGGSEGTVGPTVAIPPGQGTAVVRFCNDVGKAADPAVEMDIGGQRFSARAWQCAPGAGRACARVPAAPLPLKALRNGQEIDLGSWTPVADAGYLVSLEAIERDGGEVLVPRMLKLESAEACGGQEIDDIRYRIGAPVELEPYRAEGYTFAKPAGFARTGGDAQTHVFEPTAPGSALTRFEMKHYGPMLISQVPYPGDVIEREVAERGWTLVSKIDTSTYYAGATVDTGKPGPGRFLRVMYLYHWDMPGEDYDRLISPLRRSRHSVIDLFRAEAAFPEAAIADRLSLAYVMRSLAWATALPADDVPVEGLTGTWQEGSAGFPKDHYDPQGNYVGGLVDGSRLRVKFEPDGNYQLETLYSAMCAGDTSPGCFVEGVVETVSRGRFLAEGGVLVLTPFRCESRFYAGKTLKLESNVRCPLERIPTTVRLTRGPKGGLVMSGIAMVPVGAWSQKRTQPTRRDGPPGNWDVPIPPASHRAPAIAQWPHRRFNICGLQDPEPNEGKEAPPPLTLGEELEACAATYADDDRFTVTAPADAAPGGYFQAYVIPDAKGDFRFEISSMGGYGNVIDDLDIKFGGPGAPLHIIWQANPGWSYELYVDASQDDIYVPFRYKTKVVFHPGFADPYEPNDTISQAKPITAGTPIKASFWTASDKYKRLSYSDWFTVALQPGPATILLDEVPADVDPSITLHGPSTTRVFMFEAAEGNGMPVTIKFNAPAAGDYAIEVRGYGPLVGYSTKQPWVPESYTKPYRLLVSQP